MKWFSDWRTRLATFLTASNATVFLIDPQATSLVKERILAEDHRKVSDREKEAKVQGILNQIVATNATLHVSFPIHRSAPGLITNPEALKSSIYVTAGMTVQWRWCRAGEHSTANIAHPAKEVSSPDSVSLVSQLLSGFYLADTLSYTHTLLL